MYANLFMAFCPYISTYFSYFPYSIIVNIIKTSLIRYIKKTLTLTKINNITHMLYTLIILPSSTSFVIDIFVYVIFEKFSNALSVIWPK